MQVDWFTDADVDAYLLDDTFSCADEPLTLPSGTVVPGFQCATAASGRNPEKGSFKIPAGATWYLQLNFFDHGTPNATLVRVNVTGIP